MSDERAVEAIQLSQPTQAESPFVSIIHYEPHQLAEIARQGRLYLLADGAGGAGSGYAVSQYTVRKVLNAYYTGSALDPKTRLLDAIRQANTDIIERNKAHPERRNLATTLVAALIHNEKLLVANVGDSYVYVAWDQDIERLVPESETPPKPKTDHSSATQLLTAQATPLEKMGQSEPPEETPKKAAETQPIQPSLPPSLGMTENVKIDTYSRRLFPGDTVIMCSGSLAGFITDQEIGKAIARHPLDQASRRLLALAEERGNRDHTAISITRVSSSPVATRPPAPMTLPPAPKWSEWMSAPKPPSKTATQPTGQVIPTPKPKPALDSSRFQPLEADTSLPWRAVVLAGGAMLLLCAILLLTGLYVIPVDMLASVPFVGQAAASLRGGEDEPVEIDLPSIENGEPNQPVSESLVTETAALSPTDAAPVIESNSPLATPDSAFVSPVSTPVSPVNTPTPQSAGDSIAVSTPTAQPPTPSPTALPTIELAADCESKGRFRRDVTVPDGTQFAQAESFEKVWLIQNAGNCQWGPGFTVRHIGGDLMGSTNIVPLRDVVQPETNAEISVSMIAPAATGSYRGEWQLFDLNGEPFGPELYLEIEVVASEAASVDGSNADTLYDFIENVSNATWSSDGVTYTPLETNIETSLEVPLTEGLIAIGPGLLRGSTETGGDILLAYPDRTVGSIEGSYNIDTPLQPTDALAATIGFLKLPILPDDGVTFEIIFTPTGGAEQVILSQVVQYQDSPLTVLQPLTGIEPDQTGIFTLRVLSGQSASQDWAVWSDARLIRPK